AGSDPACPRNHAQPAGSGGAARHVARPRRGRNARSGGAPACARTARGAHQGRALRRARERRYLLRRHRGDSAARPPARPRQHPRHRVHSLLGHRGGPRQRAPAGRGDRRGEGLRDARDCRRRPAHHWLRTRARASFSCVVAMRKDTVARITRRKVMKAGPVLAGILAAPAVARAAPLKWRMVTPWPKRLPGPGGSADGVAERVNTASGGRLQVAVFAAGEVVPAFEVLDAVGSGVAEMGHTASFYWQGKQPAAVYFTTVPFGLVPSEHVAWVDAGGGQALWDELYAPFGVKPFMGGNTGVCMGGWF